MGNVSFIKPLPEIPTQQLQSRILIVDVLRGFALFGIFYAHMIFWYPGGPLPEEVYRTNMNIPSGIAIGLYMLFFIGKFFSLFSFLFGLSFYIQMQALAAKHENVVLRFVWRLAILGVIGLIHHAFWRADILTIYVPLGFILLFARNLSNKLLLILGVAFILNIPTKIIEAVSILMHGTIEFIPNNFVTDGPKYYAVMNQATFAEVVNHNMHAWKEKLDYQLTSGRLFITFGFFLLGMLAGKQQWFTDIEKNQELFRKIWKSLGLGLIALAAAGIALAIIAHLLSIDMKNSHWLRWLAGYFVDGFNSGLTFFYIASICLLMLKPKWNNRFVPLSYIGKMALTSYLTQTIFGVLLFFSFGLGLFLKTSPATNIVICCAIFAVQIMFCKYWLKSFNYGPIEWLWRSATYLKWQPLSKENP
ncbi:MAG: DUF418 domain-containing protein [Gammaproteobacteria bacterium]|nr:MAG: DUF418 domain-containing protein [Gammaproteobacteria bacterium]